jgi:hypothetical protein
MDNYKYLVSIICFFSTLFVFSDIVNAQSKEEFEKIFIKETEGKGHNIELGSFKNVSRLSYYPDTLPSWFFSPPQSTADYIYSIGISDPDQTPEEATLQAIYRAKSMAVLLNKAQIQYFRDVYTTEYQEGKQTNYRQRFDTYFKISATGSADSSSFSIIDQHFTRYNEAIVLIRYSFSSHEIRDAMPMMSTLGTVLYIEAQVGEAFEPQAEYEIISALRVPNSTLITAQFTYREKGNRFLVISEFMDKDMDFPLFIYKYSNPSWSPNTQPLVSYNGLWSFFTQEFLRHLTLTTEQSSIKIKTLGEQYSPQMSNLSREVAIKTAKMFINGIEFGEDSIGFNIYLKELY